MADVKRGFQTPPEVTGYFDGKTDRPGFSWQDVWGEEHAYAFTAAKAVDAELRTTLRTSISKAIAESRGFETWLKTVQPELQKIGWWGPRVVEDPTGMDPAQLVDFSSRRRLETIFWSNMRSARAAGQWQRLQGSKQAIPYILYVRSPAADPRLEHLAWAGTILPVDDPWWRSHFPPNGWGCLCSVRGMTGRERDKLLAREPAEGGTRYRAEAIDDGPPREFRNRRTGEVTSVPAGIDPGWHTNPGLARAETLIDNLAARLDAADPVDSTPIVEALWEDAFLQIAPKLPDKVWLPAGVSPRLEAELGAVSPIVGIDNLAIAERMERHGSTIADFARLPAILSDARIFPDLTPSKEGNVRNLFARIGRSWWRAIVVCSSTKRMRMRSLHRRDALAVARQLVRAGYGRTDLVGIGLTEEEATRALQEKRGGRGEGTTPVS